MADISVLSRLVNGAQRNVDLTNNTPVVLSIKVGGATNTELTKAILDKLILINTTADGDGTFDTRYSKKADLAAITTGKGASLVGVEDFAGHFASSTVEGVLAELYVAAGSGAADDVTYDNAASGLTATDVQAAIDEVEARVDATEIVANTAIPATQKGAALGVATLDGGGKIPVSQLPNSVMELKGFWNANTNTPTLADGAGNPGDVWEVDTAGTTDFGAGDITFAIGDWAVYAADGKYHKSLNSNEVTSVNGQTGTVVLDSDDLAEGIANLYFSDERAQDAVGTVLVDTATIDFTYDDAIPSISAIVKDNSIGAAKLATDIADQVTITGGSGVALAVASAPGMLRSLVAGEAMAANTSFLVRWALTSETAGRVYKADKDASSTSQYMAIGIALSTVAVSAGDSVTVMLMGEYTLGSSDTAFDGGDIGKEVFLGASGAMILGAALANTTNEAQFCVGVVQTTTKVWIDNKQLRGIA